MLRSLALSLFGTASLLLNAQVVTTPPAKTIRNTAKAEVVSLVISPKGDRVLVGLNKGAELYDIESGKKVRAFPFNEDDGTAVYHAAFNDNGEKVVLVGHTGKRTVWNVKTGEQEMVLRDNMTWIPEPTKLRAMGLEGKNSNFDRFYQQSEAKHGDITVRTGKHGLIEFMDAENKVVQKLEYPENKDQHHRAPLLFWEEWFITGTDDGRVLFYKL
jgi:WD40 repeat protein